MHVTHHWGSLCINCASCVSLAPTVSPPLCDQFVIRSNGPPAPPTSSIPRPPSFKPPRCGDSLMPQSKRDFILRLSEREIDDLIRPVRSGSLGADTVYALIDTRTEMVLMVTAQDIIDVVQSENNSDSAAQNDCENDEIAPTVQTVPPETLAAPENQNRKRNRRLIAFVVILIALIAIISILIAVLTTDFGQDVEPTKQPVVDPITNAILIFGGDDGQSQTQYSNKVQLYSPSEPSKSRILPVKMPIGVAGAAAGSTKDLVLIAGGVLHVEGLGTPYSDQNLLQIFNCSSQNFTLGQPMNSKRNQAAGVVFGNNFVVCGGSFEGNALKSCESLDLVTWEWKEMASMTYSRVAFSLVEVKNTLFALGGTSDVGDTDIEVLYEISSNSWQPITPLNKRNIFSLSAVNFNSGIVSCGGRINPYENLASNKCEFFDVTSKVWSEFPSMNYERLFPNLIDFSGTLYALSGRYYQDGITWIAIDNTVEVLDSDSEIWYNATSFAMKVWDSVIIAV